jgi:hypothetical protein
VNHHENNIGKIMSIWTQVCGMIRVDGVPSIGIGSSLSDLYKILGPMDLFNIPNRNCKLPKGAEGTLEYKVINRYDYKKDESSCQWAQIPIWGCLRGVDNTKEIEVWWADLLPQIKTVRDAVLYVEVQGKEPIVLLRDMK